MQLHELKPTKARKSVKRIGRGGKRGKTSGRGTKGQNARAGNSMRPEMRDIIKKLPKQRGRGKNINQAFQQKPVVINLGTIDLAFEKGASITPATLVASGIIRIKKGIKPMVKILATGELTKAFEFSGVAFSASAKEKIEKAGGKIS